MANELEHLDATGLTIYAKPLPIVASPWGDDAVAMTETGTTGYYSADVASPADRYAVYRQAGASPAATDIAVATIDRSAATAAAQAAAIKAKTDNLPDEPASKDDVQVTVQPTTLDSTAVDAIRDGLATSEQVSQITDKLPTSAYLAGSDSEDGAVEVDASLTITPYQVNTSNPRYSTRDLPPIAQGSEPTEVWTITDSEGAAVDLSGKTIRVVVCAVDKGELDANSHPFDDTLTGSFKYETGDGITIRGDDNNQVWLDHDASKTATPGVYRYFLWNVTDKLLLAKGRMPIEPAKMDLA